MSGYFTMDVTTAPGIVTVTLHSQSGYKGDVGLAFSYFDSPSPIPAIDPSGSTVFVPCGGDVTQEIEVDGTGWTLGIVASDGDQTDDISVGIL
jgi:hypothetical protein